VAPLDQGQRGHDPEPRPRVAIHRLAGLDGSLVRLGDLRVEHASRLRAAKITADLRGSGRYDRPVVEPRRTVLAVDDDPVILRLLEVNFEMEGFAVRMANDGQEGLDAALAERPDIVVCDVMMPRMSGLELVARLKGDAGTAAIPVILLSAKAQASDIRAGFDAGADDYVTKPFEPLDLVDRVLKLLPAP
jgi:CheY-like chemotaxis protein